MKSNKKVAAIVAGVGAGALGVALIGLGTGVGAQFTDSGTANAHLSVGTFSCTLSSTDSNVQISNNGHTATVILPTVESSAPGSVSAPVTVKNSGSMPLKVNWTISSSGSIFQAGHVSALPVTSGLAINSGNQRTYNVGFQWGELQNADLGTSGTASYSASCVEPQSVNPNFTLWQQDGGTASLTNGAVVLTMPASPNTAGAGVELSNVPTSLPTNAPAFTTDNYAAGSPRWYIKFADGNSVIGYPNNAAATNAAGKWAENNGNTYVDWSTVLSDHPSAQVTEVDIIMDMDQPSTTDTISCIQYGSTDLIGSGC